MLFLIYIFINKIINKILKILNKNNQILNKNFEIKNFKKINQTEKVLYKIISLFADYFLSEFMLLTS